jgi:hypothetical protein
MKNQYTRRRQGRGFADKDDIENKKSLRNQLEQQKAEAERNSAPIDGHEPESELTEGR